MNLSVLATIVVCSILITTSADAASIRGSRNLSPLEVRHSSVHKNRISDQDSTSTSSYTEEEDEDVPRFSPGLMGTRIIGGGTVSLMLCPNYFPASLIPQNFRCINFVYLQTDRNRFPYAVSMQDNIGHFCGKLLHGE